MPLVHAIWDFFDPESSHTWQKGGLSAKNARQKSMARLKSTRGTLKDCNMK